MGLDMNTCMFYASGEPTAPMTIQLVIYLKKNNNDITFILGMH